jgi:hypothetical protein
MSSRQSDPGLYLDEHLDFTTDSSHGTGTASGIEKLKSDLRWKLVGVLDEYIGGSINREDAVEIAGDVTRVLNRDDRVTEILDASYVPTADSGSVTISFTVESVFGRVDDQFSTTE